jgi:hypothetical protein
MWWRFEISLCGMKGLSEALRLIKHTRQRKPFAACLFIGITLFM